MATVKVKICGITNWDDARRAMGLGADYLGFNFYPPSPRYIAPEKARRIVARLRKRVAAVGVFVDEAEERMLAIARQVGLDFLQLHGEETPKLVARLRRRLRVIKAVRVGTSFRASRLDRYQCSSAILLDGFDNRRPGGTGKTFDWKRARAAKRYGRIFLAGGLTPENVAEAIQSAAPYAIDVCSGVEARPGKKNAQKLEKLMRAVRAAEEKRK